MMRLVDAYRIIVARNRLQQLQYVKISYGEEPYDWSYMQQHFNIFNRCSLVDTSDSIPDKSRWVKIESCGFI